MLPDPAKVMFWSVCIYLFIGLYVCVYICMYVTNFSQKLPDRMHEIFRDDFHHPRTNRLDLGSYQVKGQGPGHEKEKKNAFLSSRAQFSSDSYETKAKMFTFQFPVL